MTDAYGWRIAVGFLAVMILGVVLPLAFVSMRSRPADLGIEPYGIGKAGVVPSKDTRYTPIGQAVRTADFWLLCSTFFVCGLRRWG
jgi:hypothetical protein